MQPRWPTKKTHIDTDRHKNKRYKHRHKQRQNTDTKREKSQTKTQWTIAKDEITKMNIYIN